MFNLLTVLNSVETITTVDKNILFEDKEFVKNLTHLFNDWHSIFFNAFNHK